MHSALAKTKNWQLEIVDLLNFSFLAKESNFISAIKPILVLLCQDKVAV